MPWTVAVLVDQVDVEQQVPVGEHVGGRALADDAVLLGEHEAAVGEHVERVEVVGGQHDRLAGAG